MEKLEEKIKNLGLSDKEAKVYLALIELGQASPSETASYSGVNRATTYVILEGLKKKGLATSLEKNKKIHFVAEPPERLKNLFEIERKKLEEDFSDLKNILPDLEKLYESRGERPKVRFFEGKEGIAAIRDDILKTRTDYFYQLLPLDVIYRFFPPKVGDYREKMNKKLQKVYQKTIYYAKNKKISRPDWRFFPSQNFETEIVIYGKKAAFVAYKSKPVSILIEDENIAYTIRTVFESIWKLLK